MPERSILAWLAIGLVVGVLGKLVMPGKDPGGMIVTILIGIGGALIGRVRRGDDALDDERRVAELRRVGRRRGGGAGGLSVW